MRAESEVIWLDGRFLNPGERPTVDLRDRAYLLGDSVFATARAISGRVFLGARHLSRIREAANDLGIPWPEVDLATIIASAIERLGADDVTLRVTLSRGAGPWGIGVTGRFEPSVSVVARVTTPYPDEAYERGIVSRVLAVRRIPSVCIPARHKTGSYLGTVLARRELTSPALIEGIQLNVAGRISSGTISNIFVVKDGYLLTPPLDDDCRPGVTREVVLELAHRAGLHAMERSLLLPDLEGASEVFFTSTLMDCLPVRSIEGVADYDSVTTASELRALLRAERTR